jgi:hypothetical protein
MSDRTLKYATALAYWYSSVLFTHQCTHSVGWWQQANSRHRYTQSVTMPKNRLYVHSIHLVLAQEYALVNSLHSLTSRYVVNSYSYISGYV